MRNEYTLGDKNKLTVTEVDSKSYEDIIEVIKLGKPQAVIDKFIELYLPTINPNQQKLDDWYENELLLKSQDSSLTNTPILDEAGNVTGEILTPYNEALAWRTSFEIKNRWLKKYRGVSTTASEPIFIMTVAQWKTDNKALFNSLNKSVGATVGGKKISLDETNQNGIAAVLVGLQLADKAGANIYPINFKARTQTGETTLTFQSLTEFETFSLEFMGARQVFFA